MGLASFCLLGALSRRNDEPGRASRPFDRDRDGFVIGEGAGFVVLEELEHARARDARIYAELAGFASSSDAWRVTDPHPQGIGASLAMRGSLEAAGISPDRVGYVNAHGTSTLANDRIETRAIHEVFGAHAARLAVSSTKSIIGHLTVAAGAVEAIATILTLVNGRIHGTANLENPDPECDLDFVAVPSREADIEFAISNSFAFGGQCASLLLRRWEPRA
jgi:3-oxoacyl-[acyl-carrier-protein] synthase II